jgi:protein-disulfide isomerase
MSAAPAKIAGVALLALAGLAAAAPASITPDDMSRGNPKARITVVEYASVACPVCGRWFKEVLPAFKAKYVDTGKARLVTREMLVGDEGEVAIASTGFLMARCAGKANYYKVTDAIYASQPDLYADPKDVLLGIAQSVGMDSARLNACVSDAAALKALNDRVETYVTRDHIQSTPTFVINGTPMTPGYHSLAEIDAAIAAAKP